VALNPSVSWLGVSWQVHTHLNKGCLTRVEPRLSVDFSHEGLVCLGAGTHQALTAAIAVGSCSPDHCPHRIPVAEGVTETLDVDGCDALSSCKAVGRGVKRLARAIRRQHALVEKNRGGGRTQDEAGAADNSS